MTRLSRNILFSLFGQLLTLALSLVAVRLVFRRLGDDALGIIYFTQTISVLVTAALSLGINTTTIREVAGHHRDEPKYVRDWTRTAGLAYWLFVAVLAVVVWFLAPAFVRHWLNLTTMSQDEAIRVLRILGVCSLLTLPRALYVSVLRGMERMDVTNSLDVGIQGIRQLGSIAILSLGGGLFDIVWWLAGCRVLIVAGFAIGVARLLDRRALVPGFFWQAARRNAKFAFGAMALTIFATIHTQADRVIVSKLFPLGMLGLYGFASAAVGRARLLTNAVAMAAFPSFSVLFAARRRDVLMSQYRKLQDFLCWFLAPLLAFAAFAAIPVFTFVFSPEAARMMNVPVGLLCLGIYMNGTVFVPHQLAMASGRPQIAAKQTFLAIFSVLPVTVLLTYRLGLVGAAASWVWYYVFVYLYAIPKVCRQCCDFPVWAWYRHIARVFCAIAVTYGAAWGVLLWLGVDSITVLASAYGIATIMYGGLAYLAIGPELRATMRAHVLRLIGYVRRAGRENPGQH